ncbi:MAG: hypothetical protein Q9203_004413 [Teloschistes exilis]
MMQIAIAFAALLLLCKAFAQTNTALPDTSTLPATAIFTTSLPNLGGDLIPTGTSVSYLTLNSTKTLSSGSLSGETAILATTIAVANGTIVSVSGSPTTSSTSSISVTILQGSHTISPNISGNSTGNTTLSRTSTSAQPTNTQPCNNYPEFCSRKYSNITQVAAHNSPFVAPNNAAANQALGVIDQLNDGIRMLQGQTHYVNETMYYCHTSCDLLNVGTAESYFANITRWVHDHPYDVVTLLIGNGDLVKIDKYIAPLQSSGLTKYAYIPPEIPMGIDDWPTLSEMILTQRRVVIFMDYNADQNTVPYVLDEFSQMWETPFSPTNRSFPCSQQRPPDLSKEDIGKRMYMANHNLNTELTLAGTSLLVVTVSLLNETNAVSGFGSLGAMADECSGACSIVLILQSLTSI